MTYRTLCGIEVSSLCCGTLTVGPLQRGLSVADGAKVLSAAYERGVTFYDTAQLYDTYAYLHAALHGKDYVVASKCYAYTAVDARAAVDEARRALDRDCIDVFLLHEQESAATLRGHAEALDALYELRQRGILRAVGVSTHHVACVYAAADLPDIDVIHPIINIAGVGIVDGATDDMLAAIRYAQSRGKGIYGMKALGGGNLLTRYAEALSYAHDLALPSVAVGMGSVREVESTVDAWECLCNGQAPTVSDALHNKSLHIEPWCEGCGKCAARCSHGALTLERTARVDDTRCVLCGYCAHDCPVFAIKVY